MQLTKATQLPIYGGNRDPCSWLNCLERFFEVMQIRRRKSQPGEIISSGQRSLWLYTEANVQDDA